MEVNWSILQPVDVAGNVQRGFEMGQQMVEKHQLKSALAAYSQDPTNPANEAALASASPDFAMQLPELRQRRQRQAIDDQQRAAEQQQKLIDRHRENIINGAKLIRETKPMDQAGWDQTLQLGQQAGIDISNVPQQYDPHYVAGVMHLADTFDPPKTSEMPGIQREVDYYRSIGKNDLADQLLARHAEGPPLVVDEGSGIKKIYPPGSLGGMHLTPGTIIPDFRKQGGQTQPASGNFPH